MQQLKIPAVDPQAVPVKRFKDLFADFARADFGGLRDVYDEAVVFEDPVHRVVGLPELVRYFEDLQQGLLHCRFEFENESVGEGKAVFCWQMHYAHPRLRQARNLSLRGITYIEFDQRVIVHRDYYDMGEMLYEHIPLLGRVVAFIKRKLGGAK